MRLLPLLILVVALLLGSVANTVLEAFRRFSPTVESDRIIWDELLVGHVHHLILASSTWRRYPGDLSDPLEVWRLDPTAALLVFSLVVCAYYVVRIKLRRPLYLVGLASLPTALLPYTVGLLALRGNAIPERCWTWGDTMLLGVIYALAACVFFCGWECWRSSGTVERVWQFVKTCWREKRNFRWHQFTLRHLMLAMVLVAVLLAPVSMWWHNRSRIAAFRHLERNVSILALLGSSEPREILSGAAESPHAEKGKESVLGVKRPWPHWMDILVGLSVVSARLVGDGVNDTDLAALEHFPEMEYLELVDTAVTDDGVEKLQRALPKLHIVRR